MQAELQCPECGTIVETGASSAGTVVRCPACDLGLSVPVLAIRPGVTVSGYRLLSLLGRGGIGEVYRASHIALDREVAVKLLTDDLRHNTPYVERFLREARLAAHVTHPGVVRIHDVGEDQGFYFLAMELVPGDNLSRMLQNGHVFPEAESLRIGVSIAETMCSVNEAIALLHRDIKPANIMLEPNGAVRVMDFGLAKVTDGDVSLTGTGQILGTPRYMPPEQARSASLVTVRSDIYSLGATLHHLLAGQPAVAGDSAAEILANLLEGRVADLQTQKPGISAATTDLIGHLMAADPAERPVDWAEVIDMLEAARGETEAINRSGLGSDGPDISDSAPANPVEPITIPEDPDWDRFHETKPRTSWMLTASLLVLLAVLIWRYEHRLTPEAPIPRPPAKMGVAAPAGDAPDQTPEGGQDPLVPGPEPVPLTASSVEPAAPRTDTPTRGSEASPTAAVSPPATLPRTRPVSRPGYALPADLVPVRTPVVIDPARLAVGSAGATAAQAAYARRISLPIEAVTRRSQIRLRLIPPGRFPMGSSPKGGHDGLEETHIVTLTKPFYIGIYEITQRQWQRVMDTNPAEHKSVGMDAPVERVSWDDCNAFAFRLMVLEGLLSEVYRLPTEAEWEWACRAGTRTPYICGDSAGRGSRAQILAAVAWIKETSRGTTHRVGQLYPNAWGLFDVHGNVLEWCQDVLKPYGRRPRVDPCITGGRGDRVSRGGCYHFGPDFARSAARYGASGRFRAVWRGLRIVRDITGDTE